MNRNYNVWISLLKIVCCYLVVLVHFGQTDFAIMLNGSVGHLSVPIFMFLSFYLCGNRLYEKEGYIKTRIKRLYYPIALWSLVYFMFYNLARIVLGMELIPIKHLVYSLVIGVSERMNTPMWYSMASLILSIVFYMIMVCIKDNSKRCYVYIFIIILAELLVYTEINNYFFSELKFESKVVCGRLAECIPFAAAGILISNYHSKKRWLVSIGSLLVTGITWNMNKPAGFGYQGIHLLAMTVFICICIIQLPASCKSKLTELINCVAKYTMGIYYVHIGIGYALTMLPLEVVNNRGLAFSATVMIVSFVAVFTIDKVAEKVTFLRWMRFMVV